MAYYEPMFLLVFLPLTILIYQLLPQKIRCYFLLFINGVFYYLFSGKLIIYLAFSILNAYVSSRVIETI